MAPVYVAVVGPGEASPALASTAEAVGRGLARSGAVLVCGGLGGVMAAACRGAKAEGGMTVGILPGPDRRPANAWLDVAIATGLGEARNAVLVRSADSVIAVGKGHGTLSEVALALKMGRHVIGVDSWMVEGVRRAVDPADAVTMALKSVEPADPSS